jgi:hypothetical protein
MSAEKQPETKITIDKKTIDGILNMIVSYYPLIKIGTKWAGIDIPPEIDEIIIARQQGREVDLNKLEHALSTVKPKIGEPVMTRALAGEAWYLHYKEGMGTREIADYFTNERKCPCSHATVARWINTVDMERSASKVEAIVKVFKYGIIAGLIALSAYLSHLFWH